MYKCQWIFVADVQDQYHKKKMARLEVYPVRAVATDCAVFGALLKMQDRVPDADIAREWHPKSQARPTAEHDLLLTIHAGTVNGHSMMPLSRLCELRVQNTRATFVKSIRDSN